MSTAHEPTIALTYRRVSTYHQERDGVSLEVQTDQCLDYIRRQSGWRLGGDFQDTLSGRRADRPSYKRMLAEARRLRAQGQRVAVVTAALDRMGRDLEESVRARKELRGGDGQPEVPLHCIREGGVMGELQANIYASIAQDEAERIRSRVKASRQHNRARGYRSTSRAPWGYRWAETSEAEREATRAPLHVLRADPATVEYVREAWHHAADGQSIRAVARWVRGLTSQARGGRAFGYGNVLEMFKNPTYVGRVFEPGRKRSVPDRAALSLPRGRWEALIEDETWVDVQESIARHQRMPKQARGEYLLTGLLRCPMCGERMQGRSHTSGRLYGCNTPGKGCNFGGRADLIDGATLEQIGTLLDGLAGHDGLRSELRAEWAKLQRPADRPGAGRIKTLERVIAKARRRQDEVLGLLADKVILRERYDRFVDAEQTNIDAAERELAELRTHEAPPILPPLDKVFADLGNWQQILAGDVVAEQRSVLDALVERVVPERVIRGKYCAAITWTPYGRELHTVAQHRLS